MPLSWEEFKKISDEVEYVKPGDGDSPYTQEFLDECKGTKSEPEEE